MSSDGQYVGGKYRLVRVLGEGGMGSVFEAVHEELGKRVAIKLLLKEIANDATAIARFQQEAKAAAAIGHRGIVDIYDMGITDDGKPFIVMELLSGQSLRELLDAVPVLEVPDAAYLACQSLSALSAAHRAGIIHRDLKPENIFLVETGTVWPDVKIFDFGIARITGVTASQVVPSLTVTGVVVGTPHYMSPEHAAGRKNLDHRTDIYAMGVILYRCLTGVLPFSGENYNALMVSIIQDDAPDPGALRPDLPESLLGVVRRAMAKNRDERYDDAAQMFHDLHQLIEERAVSRVPVPEGSGDGSGGSGERRFPFRPAVVKVDRDAAEVETTPTELSGPPVMTQVPGEPRAGRGRALALLVGVCVVLLGGFIAFGWSMGARVSRPSGDPAPAGTDTRAARPRPEAPAAPAPQHAPSASVHDVVPAPPATPSDPGVVRTTDRDAAPEASVEVQGGGTDREEPHGAERGERREHHRTSSRRPAEAPHEPGPTPAKAPSPPTDPVRPASGRGDGYVYGRELD